MLKTRSSLLIGLVETDSIVTRVYADDFSPPTTLKYTFTTEQLGAQSSDAATWTVHYNLWRLYAGGMTTYSLRFGRTTYNSRIENFTRSSSGLISPVEAQGDGLTWVVT